MNKNNSIMREKKFSGMYLLPIVLFLSLIFSFSLISANLGYDDESFGTFKQGKPINIIQSCQNCSYINITSIIYPNSSILLSNLEMTNLTGLTDYNYTLTTTTIGGYWINFKSDENGVVRTAKVSLKVTPSGESDFNNVIFFLFVIVGVYTITLISFFGKNIPLTILSGMLMMALGVYMISQGIIVYRDWITNYVAYVTISMGFLLSIWAILENFNISFG